MGTINNDAAKSAAILKISEINAVEGFDPTPLAVDYTDLSTEKTEKRLPVLIQIAWFRLKYPEGKFAVTVKPVKDYFEAHARVYAHYNDPVDCYLAEASTTRMRDPNKPTVSPREWAQTAAIGVALRNAGFGLQFGAAGDSFDFNAVNELDDTSVEAPIEYSGEPGESGNSKVEAPADDNDYGEQTEPPLSPEPAEEEEPLDKAMKMLCPIAKYSDKTLGEMIGLDPKALAYVAKSIDKYDSAIVAAAKLICEDALTAAS